VVVVFSLVIFATAVRRAVDSAEVPGAVENLETV